MSSRRYYEDAYTTEFQAQIVDIITRGDQQGLVLDETYFYPASGGQPADWGTINGRSVVDVSIREADGAVVHWLNNPVEVQKTAVCAIDWPRRFDHMQHHTGQHILSQAFIRVAEAETLSFHLSENSVTIDLDRIEMTDADIDAVEMLANQVVWEDRPVTIRFVSETEAQNLPLRKIPPARNGRLRLIDVTDFDLTACGGTHVSRTGSVGLIKVIKQEKRGDKTRIEFRCGVRALQDYRDKHTIGTALSTALTTGLPQVVESVTKLIDENKAAQRTIRKQKEALLANQAESLLANASRAHGFALIKHTFAADQDVDIRGLAAQLTNHEGVVAFLGQGGKRTQLLFSRSAEAPGDMDQLLQAALAHLGSGGGGGSAKFAQGGGPGAATAAVNDALDAAYNALVSSLSA